MDTGMRIYPNVNELMLALNPAPLPEYVKDDYDGPKKKSTKKSKPKILRWLGHEDKD